MKKTAIILGASGLTGSHVLQKLIDDDRYGIIKLFSRSKIEGLSSVKVQQFIGDLMNLDQFKADFTGDEVYCNIGTTKSKTPDKSTYKNIDYGIPVAAAQLAKAKHIKTFIVVSAMGANKNSSVFYNKIKGEMEQGVLAPNLPITYILRPSLIGGNRKESRTLEKIGLKIFSLIQPLFIGPLKKFKVVNANVIANTMIYLANTKACKDTIIASDIINKLGKNN
ncbi:NAD(P)H-binding protein [Winogradskyella psychrotolerans]|uniref:NAD(P)H-binding protein n=1 Tax=Winogradskyella psychrotolerans TaxID=1344585 RepID=UPI001C06943D|nr:NAD(P)H-binding protein [Winogradskyella psychrotolerans]MBU2929304.1 NAD(P)H-binding protein [Winogradskyella psychrotolerans]